MIIKAITINKKVIIAKIINSLIKKEKIVVVSLNNTRITHNNQTIEST